MVDGPSLYTNILEDIGKLSSLRVLSLGHSETNLSMQGLFHLKNLESLEMSELSLLENNFFEKIGALNSLKMLSLSNCELNGTLPTQGSICNLASLEDLDISHNSLTGTLPDCFSNLTFLRRLDLSSNQFSGNLSLSSLKMASMEYIDVSNNQFQIPSSLQPFFNNSKLKHFNGDNNHIFVDQTELHSLAPQFQLNFISLSCCGNGGTLPKFLHYQHELQYVHLTHINLAGEFPSWLLENNSQLETLMLLNNSLSGHLKFPFHPSMKLSELDISDNFFDGHIPLEFGKYLSGLGFLNISGNSLDAGIPSSIGDMKLLQVLDLSNNRLSGVIP
ncbi:putative serine-threonine protein kinase, plant-type [Corchorus capsularis]|uniref:Putative serine-threonine protein kinase, plant-type n=1 Tax=Corchorus capsularis TaxID=210143 RepID=A0A1R3K9S9_COCAP|nr:putative serine-threonine protein kinase, plant-type [Corchorus capsularis]